MKEVQKEGKAKEEVGVAEEDIETSGQTDDTDGPKVKMVPESDLNALRSSLDRRFAELAKENRRMQEDYRKRLEQAEEEKLRLIEDPTERANAQIEFWKKRADAYEASERQREQRMFTMEKYATEYGVPVDVMKSAGTAEEVARLAVDWQRIRIAELEKEAASKQRAKAEEETPKVSGSPGPSPTGGPTTRLDEIQAELEELKTEVRKPMSERTMTDKARKKKYSALKREQQKLTRVVAKEAK